MLELDGAQHFRTVSPSVLIPQDLDGFLPKLARPTLQDRNSELAESLASPGSETVVSVPGIADGSMGRRHVPPTTTVFGGIGQFTMKLWLLSDLQLGHGSGPKKSTDLVPQGVLTGLPVDETRLQRLFEFVGRIERDADSYLVRECVNPLEALFHALELVDEGVEVRVLHGRNRITLYNFIASKVEHDQSARKKKNASANQDKADDTKIRLFHPSPPSWMTVLRLAHFDV